MTKENLKNLKECPIIIQAMNGLLKGAYKIEVIEGQPRPIANSLTRYLNKQAAQERVRELMARGAVLDETMQKRLD